jgi:hypothetical protein
MGLLNVMPQELLRDNTIPIYVVYFAPSFKNQSLPWLWSKHIRRVPLYSKKLEIKQSNIASHEAVEKYMSTMLSGQNVGDLLQSGRLQILSCWDKCTTGKIVTPYTHTVVGAMVDTHIPSSVGIPEQVKKFVGSDKRCVYMTLGSFACEAQDFVLKFAETLSEHDYRLFYHDLGDIFTTDDIPHNVLVYKTPLPHEWIVPRCVLVATTGSVCLVNVCLYHAVPMVMFPRLNEQFFWARNYLHKTGVPYLDFSFCAGENLSLERKIKEMVTKARTHKAMSYLMRVSKSMHAHRGEVRISDIVMANFSD